MTVGPEQVRAAREVLGELVRRTPVEPSRLLSERVGGPVLLKCENLQRTGAFKIRGAYHRLSRLRPLRPVVHEVLDLAQDLRRTA